MTVDHLPTKIRFIWKKVLSSMALVMLSGYSVLMIYQLVIVGPAIVHLQEDKLVLTLENNAAELNSYSRQHLDLATNLSRQGESFYELSRAVGNVYAAKDWEFLVSRELIKAVRLSSSALGGGLFFEPNMFDPTMRYRGFYAQWVPAVGESRKVEATMAWSTPSSDYHNQNWYRMLIPKGWIANRHLYVDSAWSGPRRDPISLVPLISVGKAMYNDAGVLIGMSLVDWNLDQLAEVIDKSRPTPNTIAVLFSPTSKIFAAVAGLQGLNLEPLDKARWWKFLQLNPPQDRFEMIKDQEDGEVSIRLYSRMLTNGL